MNSIPVYNNLSDNDSDSEVDQPSVCQKTTVVAKTTAVIENQNIQERSESEYEDEESFTELDDTPGLGLESNPGSSTENLSGNNSVKTVETVTLEKVQETVHTPPVRHIYKKLYTKLAGINYIQTPKHTYICLQNDEQLCVVGHMNFRIVKGGMVYNGQHFNASPTQQYNLHHPIVKSIAIIQSSHYASFREEVFLNHQELQLLSDQVYVDAHDRDFQTEGFRMEDYQTILKVATFQKDSSRINDINILAAKYQNVWKSASSDDYLKAFQILTQQEMKKFKTLDISQEWKATLQSLMVKHNDPNQTNLRVMIIGGKNSGKSTLNKILLQNFLYSSPSASLNYIDLDAGQCEFSTPNCISAVELRSGSTHILGDPLIQRNSFPDHAVHVVKETFLGSANPNLFPVSYMESCVETITSMFDHDSINPTLINLPGWVKGFGIELLQKVIKAYQPTDLIVLESSRQSQDDALFKNLNLLDLPVFHVDGHTSYSTQIYRLQGIFKDADKSIVQHHWHASHIREYKLLTYFHQQAIANKFDFTPLLQQVPKRISFGMNNNSSQKNYGIIKGFKFLNSLGINRLNSEDVNTIANSLNGSVVGLHSLVTLNESSENEPLQHMKTNTTFPVVQKISKNTELKFLVLAVIHSVDIENSFVNIYIPQRYQNIVDKIVKSGEQDLIVVKGSVELPPCELIPENGCLVNYMNAQESAEYPDFIDTNKKRKLNDHVWKVRNNILRKGQVVKP